MMHRLWRYDIRRCRMIYLLRKYDIISVPMGTDIIEKKSPLSVDKSDFFLGGGEGN